MNYEILKSQYNDDIQQIQVLMGVKDVLEIDPPVDTFPGIPVDGQRWIRQISVSFSGTELEVHSLLVAPLSPGATEISLQDVSRFPNNGSITINRNGASSEVLTYVGRDVVNNKLIGVLNVIYSHDVDEIVYPSVDVDFLGAYEVELMPFGLWNMRGPVRYGYTQVLLNGATSLRENVDFTVVNDFTGTTCIRTRLRFMQGGQPRRFSASDFLDVIYEFFVQQIGTIKIYTTPGHTSYVNVFETGTVGIAFGTLQSIERNTAPIGNYKITPPFSNTTLPPTPIKVVIPDIHLPVDIITMEEVTPSTNGGNFAISDASYFPQTGTLSDVTDDTENRKVFIGGDTIYYNRIDKIQNKLIGVSGITGTHPSGSEVVYDGAKFVRDAVKNAFNISPLGGQVDALAIDIGGRYLELKSKVANSNFNLQPGTYELFYIGFSDDTDRGLHSDIVTSMPFENKDLTFERYKAIIDRREIAEGLLGQTVSRRTVLTPTNPTDVTFDIP